MSNEQFCLLSEARPKEKAQLAEAILDPKEYLEDLGSSLAKAKKFADMTELTLDDGTDTGIAPRHCSQRYCL